MELPPQQCTILDHNGFRILPKPTETYQAIRLHSITEQTDTCALPADCHHLLPTIKGDADITPTEAGPRPRRPHTPTYVVGNHDSTPGPHPMASHRAHLPRPQGPHTHLATQVGGHPWRPPPGTPRTHAHQEQPLAGARSSPSSTRHTHPGVMGICHNQKPTSSGGHQDRTIHPIGPDRKPTPQHPMRLHHFVGISRPRHPHPPTSPPPPRQQHDRPP